MYEVFALSPCSSPESKTETIPGWFKPAAASASFLNLAIKEGSRAKSLRNIFTATCLDNRLSSAIYTSAIPPVPIISPSS